MTDDAAEQTTRKRLPIAKVILGAFLIPWHLRALFLRALAVPIVCQILLVLAWDYAAHALTSSAAWLLYVVYLLLFTLIAVRCHRLMLLDAETERVTELPKWTWRETRFLGYCLALWLIATPVFMIALTVISIPFVNLPATSSAGVVPPYVGYLASIPAYYFFARFCLTLPAVAIDADSRLGVAWAHSSGNGWRLFIVVGVLPFAISYLLSLIYFAERNVVLDMLYAVLTNVLLVVEIAALSLSYRELR
jgi:hypothetical protein